MMTWIPTYSAVEFDLANPRAEDVRALDIAVSLSRTARFSGHTRRMYSVAQHSVLVAKLLTAHCYDRQVVRAGLLHDAAEAYIGDLTSPLKQVLGACVAKVEGRIQAAIEERFELEPGSLESAEVKLADRTILATERRDLCVSTPTDWQELPPPIEARIVVAHCDDVALGMFNDKFAELFGRSPLLWDRWAEAEGRGQPLVLPCERV